jgi:hypothetical protein
MTDTPTHLDRDDRRYLYADAAKANPFKNVDYEPGPYVDTDGEPTAAGRDLVMKSVAAGNLQDFVADQLGIRPRDFAKKVKSPTTSWAALWAVANAAADSALIRIMVWRATVLKDPESLKFILRIRGFSEKTAPTANINIDIGKFALAPPGLPYEEFLEFQKTMSLEGKTAWADSHSESAYMKKIGQTTDAPRVITDKSAPSCDDPVGGELTAVNPDE